MAESNFMTDPDYTAMLAAQTAETVDIVTFDTEIEQQCSMADPKTVTVTLDPCGATALSDAVGQSCTSSSPTVMRTPAASSVAMPCARS